MSTAATRVDLSGDARVVKRVVKRVVMRGVIGNECSALHAKC